MAKRRRVKTEREFNLAAVREVLRIFRRGLARLEAIEKDLKRARKRDDTSSTEAERAAAFEAIGPRKLSPHVGADGLGPVVPRDLGTFLDPHPLLDDEE